MSFRARIAKENADLTVLNPPGRAAVLARNPHRMAALLQEPGLVENQDARRIAKPLDHIIPADVARLLLIPLRPAKQRLHPPGRRIASVFGQLPAVLAFGAANQPLKKKADLSSRLSATKQSANTILQCRKVFKPRQRRARPIRNRHPSPPAKSNLGGYSLRKIITTVVLERPKADAKRIGSACVGPR